MPRSHAIPCVLILSAAAACVDPPDEGVETELAAHQQGASADAVLGFEDASLWDGHGVVGTVATHSEGALALAVRPAGDASYRSDRFAFEGRPRRILVDVQLPASNGGFVKLYVDSDSHSCNDNDGYVGQLDLAGRPVGVFTTLSFDVPAAVGEQLGSETDDLQLRLVFDVPNSHAVYLIDHMRILTDLRLHYRFDATPAAGVVLDSSGYRLDGALRGAAALTPTGRIGSALNLDGATAFVEVPAGVTESLQEITVTAWVNLNSLGAWSRIFDFGGAAGFVFLTPSTHDGLIRYSDFAGFGIEGTVTGPALPTGAWKHVAVTASGRDYRIYVDGVEAAYTLTEPVTPAQIGVNNTGNWIGRSRFPDPLLNGRIDDFRIYDRVLDRSEIVELARPGLDYAVWGFDESFGNTVRDGSDLDLDGNISGSTTFVSGLIDGALRLKGNGGHVRLPAGLVRTCNDLTAAAWVNLRTNPPWNRVFDFGQPNASTFMYLSPAGFGAAGQELRFGLVTPLGVHDVGFPYIMPLGEWTHLAVVLRDQTVTLFLNGRPVVRRSGIVSNPSDMGITAGNFFGRSTFPDAPFDGTLDEIRLACRAYDDREIAQLAHLPAPEELPDQRPVLGAIQDVHDPAMIRSAGKYRLFSTGPGLMTRTSDDLVTWTFTGSVFAQNPTWVTQKFGAIDALWAPDISRFGGTNHLYYAASTFGSNHSCIGHATKSDLGSAVPWVDRGPVICSNDNGTVDDWNAIDANVIVDTAGTAWLSFGSFWGGLKMIRLTAAGDRADTQLFSIARRPIETSVEAPYIIYRAPYYYLFASFDFCCQGANSSYRVVVGRSRSVTGPYLDRTGLPMMEGGGTPVVSGGSRWRGPGHNAIIERNGELLNVYHSYDALANGRPTLRVSELVWQEGWPVSAEP